MGVLNQMNPKYTQYQESFIQLTKFKSLEELNSFSQTNTEEFKLLVELLDDPSAFKYTIFQYASSKYLIEHSI